jgi:L,D-peptidoglycan transpeptidase YkuD (ErfK/YbiS/YcfS/YnhG family)
MNSYPLAKRRSHPITNPPVRCIFVQSLPGNPQKGRIFAGNLRFACALGKAGTTRKKREGDGATPLGSFRLRRLWYRRDQCSRPRSGLLIRSITPKDGWCDAPSHVRYNRPVHLPFPASHEAMWRPDPLYDYVIEIGWNDRPAIPGKGSAIFFHLARAGYLPTQGCVAVSKGDMRKLLPWLGKQTRIMIR